MHNKQHHDRHDQCCWFSLTAKKNSQKDPNSRDRRIDVESETDPDGEEDVDDNQGETGLPGVLVWVGLGHQPAHSNETVVQPVEAEKDTEEEGHRSVDEDRVQGARTGLRV